MPGGGYGHSGCVCVHMPSDMGTGGSGMPPMPPTGSGSGTGGSGSGATPLPPTGGNGTGRENLVRRGLTDPLAVCNDGSRAAYYDSNDLADSKKLHIYLKGGGACTSFDQGAEKSCVRRCGVNIDGELCTARTEENFELDTDTMWSTDPQQNPAFHDFARVYVPYCSSDLYIGTRDDSDVSGYYFHGKYIVKAIAEDIVSRANSLEQVVFYGTSAGAMGVAFNCDAVAEILKAKFPNLDVRCVSDGNDFFPVDSSMNTDTCELSADGAQEAFWGAKPDSSCESDAASNQECSAFATNYKHITTPIMVVQTLTDPTVKHDCSPEVTENPDYWVTYRNKVAALAEQFKQDKPNNGLWVPNCIYHVSQGKPWSWGGMPVGETAGQQLTLREALTNWISGSGSFQVVDPAQTINPACPANNQW